MVCSCKITDSPITSIVTLTPTNFTMFLEDLETRYKITFYWPLQSPKQGFIQLSLYQGSRVAPGLFLTQYRRYLCDKFIITCTCFEGCFHDTALWNTLGTQFCHEELSCFDHVYSPYSQNFSQTKHRLQLENRHDCTTQMFIVIILLVCKFYYGIVCASIGNQKLSYMS